MFNFNFARAGNDRADKGCLRLNVTHLVLSDDVGALYGLTNAGDSVPLVIEYDTTNQAIRLGEPTEGEIGYTCTISSQQKQGSTYKAKPTVCVPKDLKTSHMPRGVYRQLPEDPTIFVYEDKLYEMGLLKDNPANALMPREPELNLAREPGDVRKGDRVQWAVKAKDTGERFMSFGTVVELVEHKRLASAVVLVESPEHRKHFRTVTKVTVALGKLMVIK